MAEWSRRNSCRGRFPPSNKCGPRGRRGRKRDGSSAEVARRAGSRHHAGRSIDSRCFDATNLPGTVRHRPGTRGAGSLHRDIQIKSKGRTCQKDVLQRVRIVRDEVVREGNEADRISVAADGRRDAFAVGWGRQRTRGSARKKGIGHATRGGRRGNDRRVQAGVTDEDIFDAILNNSVQIRCLGSKGDSLTRGAGGRDRGRAALTDTWVFAQAVCRRRAVRRGGEQRRCRAGRRRDDRNAGAGVAHVHFLGRTYTRDQVRGGGSESDEAAVLRNRGFRARSIGRRDTIRRGHQAGYGSAGVARHADRRDASRASRRFRSIHSGLLR